MIFLGESYPSGLKFINDALKFLITHLGVSKEDPNT